MPQVTHHEQYILHITAGPTYNTKEHEDVLINTEKPVHISSDLIDAKIHMRIKDYRGTTIHSAHTSYKPILIQPPTRSPQRLTLHIALLLHPATSLRPLLHLLLLHSQTRHPRRPARLRQRLRPPDPRSPAPALRQGVWYSKVVD